MATLSFKTQFPWGYQTYFIPKIWRGLIDNMGMYSDYMSYVNTILNSGNDKIMEAFFPVKDINTISPKIHTIREDKHDLWKPGRKIHMAVFNRTKDRFQFAPVLECKSVQKIEIRYIPEMPGRGCIKINGIFKSVFNSNFSDDKDFLNQLALNDGFNSIEDFFRFFNKDFTGKIIHFTDFRY